MLAVGERAPLEGRVWTTPRESATLAELRDGGPILLLVYLVDWSST